MDEQALVSFFKQHGMSDEDINKTLDNIRKQNSMTIQQAQPKYMIEGQRNAKVRISIDEKKKKDKFNEQKSQQADALTFGFTPTRNNAAQQVGAEDIATNVAGTLIGEATVQGLPRFAAMLFGRTNAGRALYLNRALNSAVEEIPSTIPQYKAISYEAPKNVQNGYMGLYERAPKRISIAERMGIPKGERSTYHTIAENEQFAQEANNFAQKYGYPKIVYDPSNITTEQLNSQVKSMLDRHNTFLRGTVPESPFIEDTEQAIKALGQNYTPEQYQIYAATHPRTWGEEALEPAIFVGDQNAHIYGNGKAAAVQYPYKLGKDRSKWLIEGDTPIYYSNGLTAQERINKGFRGIISPWEFKQEGISSGGTNELMTVSDIPLIFKEWSTPEKPYPIRIPMKANKLFETLQ